MADVLTLSPALMDSLRVGRPKNRPPHRRTLATRADRRDAYKVPILMVQDDRMSDDLPFGSRGGIAIHPPFSGRWPVRPQDSPASQLRGLRPWHRDAARARRPARRRPRHAVHRWAATSHSSRARQPATPGTSSETPSGRSTRSSPTRTWRCASWHRRVRHVVGVSFVRDFAEPDGVLQPRQTTFALAVNDLRDGHAAVDQVAIGGPYTIDGPGDTPSRRAVFICRPLDRGSEEPCAREILSALARRAYRRPVSDADLDTLLGFYDAGRTRGHLRRWYSAGLGTTS